MTDENRSDDIDDDVDPDADTSSDHDESAIDQMRDSGVGVEDPNITGQATPGIVEEQVQPDEPPQV